jgi:hypothetical protein
MLISIIECKCEQREHGCFAVATATDSSLWEYELFEATYGDLFCREIVRRGSIRSELWRKISEPAQVQVHLRGGAS